MFGKRLKLAAALGAASLSIALSAVTASAAMVEMTLNYDGTNHAYRAEEVHLTVNGAEVTGLDVPPLILNDRTLVPLRAVAEKLGAEVNWNADTQEAYLLRGDEVVVIQIDNPQGIRNGEAFTMDVAPKIINDRTLMPIRYVAEALGCYVDWQGDTRTVAVSETEPAPSTPETPEPQAPETPSGSAQTGAEIQVTGVGVPKAADSKQVFTIQTTGEISKYESLLVGTDRLAVDLYYATLNMSGNIAVDDNPVVSSIRAAQNQVTPNKITRVVFDLKGNTGYSVSLSDDKKSLLVSFKENNITSLEVSSTQKIDTVTLFGDDQPAASVTYMTDPKRLVIDIANAKSGLRSSYSAADCGFITDIRTSQYTESSVRVVLEITDDAEYYVSDTDDSFTVQVFKSALQNISYDAGGRVLTLNKGRGLDLDSIRHNDDYLNLTYTMTLPGDYEDDFGYGILRVQDGYLGSIVVDNNENGDTVLTFHENQIMAYTVTEDDDHLYIRVQTPKEKYQSVVLIDAGHGAGDPGTSGNGYIEKNLNLAILQKVMALFEANGNIKAYATRLSDTYPENVARAAMGNQIADVFVSIHQNAALGNTTANGIEVFYTPHENEVGGKLTSKIAAEIMQKYLINATGANSRGAKNDPALIVLNQSTTNAILVECGFLTNAEEAAKLGSDGYQQTIATAIYSAIVDMLAQYPTR